MPTHFSDTLYAIVNGTEIKIGKPQNIELTSTALADTNEYISLWNGMSGTFTCMWSNPNSRNWKRLQRIKNKGNNNWRKMHGLPLRRYV